MNNFLQRAQDAAAEAAVRAQDAAKVAAGRAQEAAQRAQTAAQNIDVDRINDGLHKLGSNLQKKASGLLEKASFKEVVVVEGQSLQLTRQLAEGGFGFVYLARQTQTGKEYAVKRMIGQDSESTQLATAEVELLKSLTHPNIVKLHASSRTPRENGGVDFLLVMEVRKQCTACTWCVKPMPPAALSPCMQRFLLSARPANARLAFGCLLPGSSPPTARSHAGSRPMRPQARCRRRSARSGSLPISTTRARRSPSSTLAPRL